MIIGNGNITTPEFNEYHWLNAFSEFGFPGDAEVTLTPSNILFQVGTYQGESVFTVTKNGQVIINGMLYVKKWSFFPFESQEREPSNRSTIQQETNTDPFLKEYEIKEGEKLVKYDVVRFEIDKTVSKYNYNPDGNKEKFIAGVVEDVISENKCLVRIYGETFVHNKISEFLPQSWLIFYGSKNNTNDLCEVFIK